MNSDRLLSIAGGVSVFVLLAIFPAVTALVSAYGLFFNTSTITDNLSLLNDVVPDNVLSIVHEQASRIASNSGRALSIGFVVGIVASLWSAMSGVKAIIDALNVIYEQKEGRNVLKLNVVALVFTLAGFAPHRRPTADPFPDRARQHDRNADADRALAGASRRPPNWSCRPLPLRPRSPRGALAVGQRWQRICSGDVDRRVAPTTHGAIARTSTSKNQYSNQLPAATDCAWPERFRSEQI